MKYMIERVNNGEITVEEAEAVNELAYERHVVKEEFIDELFNEWYNEKITSEELINLINISEGKAYTDKYQTIKDDIDENKLYKETFKKAYDEYSTNMKMIKMCVRNKDYKRAKMFIKDANDSLKDLEQKLDDTPRTLSAANISSLSKMCKFSVASLLITYIASLISNDEMTKKDIAKSAIHGANVSILTDYTKITDTGEVNTFIARTKKLITKEKKDLYTLEKKINKLQK